MSDVGPVGSTIAAASQSLRDTSKWLVGGVVATAAGVFAGASLTSFGSLNPSTDTLRFGLAIYGLVFGFVALAFILRAATKVLTLESISLDELLSSNNPELIDLKTILNQRYKHLLPQGTNTLGEYSGAVDAVSRKEEKTDNDQAYLDRAARDKALITADARFLFVRKRFERLISLLWWTTPLAIFGFGLFAWAANPPKSASETQASVIQSMAIQRQTVEAQAETAAIHKQTAEAQAQTAAIQRQTAEAQARATGVQVQSSASVDDGKYAPLVTGFALFISGIALSLIARSQAARRLGFALIAAAPFVSGLTFFKIEKPSIKWIWEAKDGKTGSPILGDCGSAGDVEVASAPTKDLCSSGEASAVTGSGPWRWICRGSNGGASSRCSAPLKPGPITLAEGGKLDEQPFTAQFTLPPFASGSAKPDKHLACFLQHVTDGLRKTSSVNSITIQATADRRELRSETLRHYGSNWALAQQRGACVSRIIREHVFSIERIFVTNAGPLYTGSTIEGDLERDRSVTLSIFGRGKRPSWIDELSNDFSDKEGGDPTCKPETLELSSLVCN